jgi:hypothetical protein
VVVVVTVRQLKGHRRHSAFQQRTSYVGWMVLQYSDTKIPQCGVTDAGDAHGISNGC